MAETSSATLEQPAARAAPAYKLSPVFTTKEKPTCPPFEPGDRSWVEDWYWDFDNPDVEDDDGIISHLEPGSLLAISRASRLFRSLTFTKRAEAIWMEARRRNGWRDLEAGGMNEIQHAKLVEGRICFVCSTELEAWEACMRDFSLRTVHCRPCALRLIKEGDAISTEFWHLHPHTFSCCLSTRKKPGGGDVPDGQDSLFYTPEVLDQAAMLYKKEASALARNEALESASLAHVTCRTIFKGQVRRDAAKMPANEASLAEAQQDQDERRHRLRQEMITERMVALGWEEQDFRCPTMRHIACDAPWCRRCLEGDVEDIYEKWETTSSEDGDRSEVDDLLAEDEEKREIRIFEKLKAEMHGDCIPAPFEYDERFLGDNMLLTSQEWDACKGPLIEYAARNEHERLWREAQEDEEYRQEELKPLFQRLKGVVAPSAEPVVLRDVFDHIHRDKVRLFDRIARAHLAAGVALPTFIKKVLGCESAPFVDCDPSKGLASLHAVLTDSDMDPMLTNLTSLFRCGICSAKRTYPAIAIHLVDEHDVTNVPAYANVPSDAFRQATKGLLDDFDTSSDTSFAAFETAHGDARFDVTTRASSGEMETSVGETWAHVLSGKSPAELEAARRKLSASTDRDIVKIRLSIVHSEQAADSAPI